MIDTAAWLWGNYGGRFLASALGIWVILGIAYPRVWGKAARPVSRLIFPALGLLLHRLIAHRHATSVDSVWYFGLVGWAWDPWGSLFLYSTSWICGASVITRIGLPKFYFINGILADATIIGLLWSRFNSVEGKSDDDR